VEHPVTELVTGIDLVEWQLRIAAGEHLPFTQDAIRPRGWAIECRITSEDHANGFLPSTGKVDFVHAPAGPGVRWDGGVDSGSEISLFYDPMIGKLIVWAANREIAIDRMRRALHELTFTGVETSRDFHLRVLADDEFRRGAIDIQWLERRLSDLLRERPDDDAIDVAAIAAALLARRDRHAPAPASNSIEKTNGSHANGQESEWTRVARLESLR